MTAQGLEVIDQSVYLTHEWINELAGRLDWSSKRSALRLMRVTLHRIRDHLLVDEVAQFSAQLPVMIRGFFFESWVPKDTPIKERHAEDFIAFIRHQMGETAEYRGQDDIKCVFDLLNARISRGEVEDIRASLPQDLRDLWPAP
ncbi:DUF2267 domain-containing protein [Sulfitobacter sp. TSTF-M16]|uniref:DUF2267 domain-containing protein n=1 Tax=Sulfitobacter aestuariivivens TaxID=2766981 RepID=A0A927HHM4_9RHOB|nr:DUF2267 domain-containing protein [Sulfitobacter aestuariivivens]MBD3665410.1 DUF2267 domain-containing protein [Sulfitobacter aestuariivivens]